MRLPDHGCFQGVFIMYHNKKSGFLSPTLWDFTRRMYVRVLLTKLWNTVTLLRFLLLWMGRISGDYSLGEESILTLPNF